MRFSNPIAIWCRTVITSMATRGEAILEFDYYLKCISKYSKLHNLFLCKNVISRFLLKAKIQGVCWVSNLKTSTIEFSKAKMRKPLSKYLWKIPIKLEEFSHITKGSKNFTTVLTLMATLELQLTNLFCALDG